MSNNPSVIQWDGVEDLNISEFRLEIPNHTNGRVQIYKVPISSKNLEGYWVSLNTSTNPYENHEPSLPQKDFIHLCTVEYVNGRGIIKQCHPHIRVYPHLLNPRMKR